MNNMDSGLIEGMLIFKIDSNYLETRGELLCNTIDKWNRENGCETYSSTFVLEDSQGDLMVDYSFDKNNKVNIKKHTEQILNRFNIQYKEEK